MACFVLVLGMHRSGTSAVTGALQHLGVELGDNLLPAREAENPRGFFERADVLWLNERLFTSLGSFWDDVRPLAGVDFAAPGLGTLRAELEGLATALAARGPLCAIKDPRLCRLLPFWASALRELGHRVCFLLVQRRAAEVAQSLARRNRFSAEKSALLWAGHLLAAERHTRGEPRTLVRYEQLLRAPEQVLGEAGRALDIRWPRPPAAVAAQLRDFVSPDLRHHASAAVGVDFGRMTALVAAIEDAFGEIGTLADIAAPALDRAGRDLAAAVAGLDPLMLELVSELRSARLPALHDELSSTLAERTRWLQALAAGLEDHRQALAGLSQQMAEHGRWLRAQAAEIERQRLAFGELQSEVGKMGTHQVHLEAHAAELTTAVLHYKRLAEKSDERSTPPHPDR